MKTNWLAVGIILLLIGISYSPVITAEKTSDLSTTSQYHEKTVVPVHCYEYKSDGTIEKTLILLPKNEYLKMTQNLSLTTSLDEILRVYQRYGVIPSNVTTQKMKENFDEYLMRKNINISAVQKYYDSSSDTFRVIENSYCQIETSAALGIHLHLGMTAITQFWNAIEKYHYTYGNHQPTYISGKDFCDVTINIDGLVHVSNGTSPGSFVIFSIYGMFLLGFVGYYVTTLPLPMLNIANDWCLGYTVYLLAAGKIRYDYFIT
jgi:hypothetical protein